MKEKTIYLMSLFVWNKECRYKNVSLNAKETDKSYVLEETAALRKRIKKEDLFNIQTIFVENSEIIKYHIFYDDTKTEKEMRKKLFTFVREKVNDYMKNIKETEKQLKAFAKENGL